MVNITPLTLVIEFIPPLIVTLGYLLVFQSKRNRFIEALIALMFIKTLTFFLFGIWYQSPLAGPGFDPAVDSNTFYFILLTDFLYHFSYGLQELLTWIMVSFVAVLFGMLVLALKMLLQDPLKMKFKNVIQKIAGKTPESDGYEGFRNRLNNLRFEGVDPNPLDPEVQSQAWSAAWKDYLIIGLATLLPTIPIYIGTLPVYIHNLTVIDPADLILPNTYILAVVIFLTWIYRFGYPASNRIAKGAGLMLGERDVGSEMMRGVLGWFFRLNILITLLTIAFDVQRALAAGMLHYLGQYYIDGVFQAAPPILFAIIVLPLAERFAVVLYKRTFESLNNVGKKVRTINWKQSIANSGAAITTGGIGAAALIAAIMGVTLYAAYWVTGTFTIFPGGIHHAIRVILLFPSNNQQLIIPTIWLLMIFAIPLGMMLLLGVIGHFVRDRLSGGMESFALLAGFVMAMVPYFIFPNLDYIIGAATIEGEYAGLTFYRLRPILEIPGPGLGIYLYRLALQFVVNVPIYISTTLFVLYYFEFRKQWQEKSTGEKGSMLSVHSDDIKHTVVMFVGGLILSALFAAILAYTVDPIFAGNVVNALIIEIGAPDGLELVLAVLGSDFIILVEHNVYRTFLMLIIGPVFWSCVLWLIAVQKKKEEQNIALSGIIVTLLSAALAVIWTQYDLMTGVFVPSTSPWDVYWPFTYSAQLGLRAAIVLGAVLGLYLLIGMTRKATGRDLGGWWFPPILLLIGLEYFVYDDQFTLIALVMLPMILAGLYRLVYINRPEVAQEDFLITYIRFSLMSLAIAEVLSTALWVGGDFMLHFIAGVPMMFLARILPHAIVEIPAFLFVAAVSIRIARDLSPVIQREAWDEVVPATKEILTDGRVWRTYLLVVFFLIVGALIESTISRITWFMFGGPLPPA